MIDRNILRRQRVTVFLFIYLAMHLKLPIFSLDGSYFNRSFCDLDVYH